MKLLRRQFLHLAAGAAALPAVSRMAAAQAYPTQPVRNDLPFAPGGPSDVFARLTARTHRATPKAVLCWNIAGANTNVSTGQAAKAAPDGYTISSRPITLS